MDQESKKIKKKVTIGRIFYYIFLAIVLIATGFYLFFNIKNSLDLENKLEALISTAMIGLVAVGFIIVSIFIKGKKIIISCVTGLFLLAFFTLNVGLKANVLNLPTQDIVPDFTKQSIVKVMDWAKENKIDVASTYEYSDNIAFNYIVSQDIKDGTLIKDIEKMEVIISNGPDFNKTFIMPNTVGWELEELLKVIKDNHLSNVNLEFILSETKKDIILEQDISGEIKRNNLINIKVSLGNAQDLKPVALIDLKDNTVFDATLFLKRNGLKYELKYEFHDTVEKGKVISFTPKKGTTIKPLDENDKVIVIISKGKATIVPDIMNMSKEEITKWAALNSIRVNFQERYHETIAKDKVIEASYKKDDQIEQGMSIDIVLSQGQLVLPSFNSAIELKNFCNQYGIQYNESYKYSDLAAGSIISVNKKEGDTITSTDVINVVISQGKAITIPNYIGMTKANIQASCNKLKLKCSFTYGDYGTTGKDTAIDQSKKAGTQVVANSSIIIKLSKGNPATFTVILQPSWFTTQSSATTVNFLNGYLNETNFPGINFVIKTQTSNLSSGLYLAECSTINTGSKVTQGQSYTICVSQ